MVKLFTFLFVFTFLVAINSAFFIESLLTPVKCYVLPWKCSKEEHGLWNFPREIIKALVNSSLNVFRHVTDDLGLSNITKGLDTDNLFSNCTNIDEFKDRLKLIFPGTKWCGAGQVAKNYSDVGIFSYVDACCRAHDMYPIFIMQGETKYGLKNGGIFKRSECKADHEFHQCLAKHSFNLVAHSIGYTYFTILRPQCFTKDYPILICYFWFNGKCVWWKKDKNAPKVYQWRDNPIFI